MSRLQQINNVIAVAVARLDDVRHAELEQLTLCIYKEHFEGKRSREDFAVVVAMLTLLFEENLNENS